MLLMKVSGVCYMQDLFKNAHKIIGQIIICYFYLPARKFYVFLLRIMSYPSMMKFFSQVKEPSNNFP